MTDDRTEQDRTEPRTEQDQEQDQEQIKKLEEPWKDQRKKKKTERTNGEEL